MVQMFYTLGSGQPGGPGHIRVEGPTEALCRQAVHHYTGGRFAFDYVDLEKIHPLDRKESAHLVVAEGGTEYEAVHGFVD